MAALVVLLHGTGVFADEIKVLSSVALKPVVDQLAPQFEKTTKHKVTAVFGLAAALKAQIEKAEPFDVAILTLSKGEGAEQSPRRRIVATGCRDADGHYIGRMSQVCVARHLTAKKVSQVALRQWPDADFAELNRFVEIQSIYQKHGLCAPRPLHPRLRPRATADERHVDRAVPG